MWQIFCVRDRLNPIMKRTIIIAFMLFAFSSCNNGKNNADSSTSGPDTINNGNQASVPVLMEIQEAAQKALPAKPLSQIQ